VTVSGFDKTHYETSGFRNLDYLARRFFSAGPASALWEAIPYSFVLDWFVNSANVIDNLDNALTGSIRGVTDSCVSEKWNVVVTVKIYDPNPFYEINTYHDADYGISEIDSYHRRPLSLSSWVGKSDRFGKKQASLLAALLHQQVANLRG
jgi:hypothetical protein